MLDERTMKLIREAEITSALFMGDGATAPIEVLLAHNEEPDLAALAFANICESSWFAQGDKKHFSLTAVKERWLTLARTLAVVADPELQVRLFHETRNSTALGRELDLSPIVAAAGGDEGARPQAAGGGAGGGDDDGFRRPEMQLTWALENLTAVLFAVGVPEQERAKLQLAHAQVARAWKMLAAEGKLPPPQ